MSTIKAYESKETIELQTLLKEYEELLEENELHIDERKSKNMDHKKLETISNDFEIDISLIRMELNRRLWKD
jgi:hypothetical protein